VSGWTALVLAGSRPGRDPLAEHFGTDLKALIPVGGVPMVRRPVEALLASEWIGRIIVVAQQPERIAEALPADARVEVKPSQDTIAATLEAICADFDTQWPLLVTTADHALLSPQIIDSFCRRSLRTDISIALVERRAVMRRFPSAQRTWIRFRGGAYTGANLFQRRSPKSIPAIRVWRDLEQDRKKRLRLLWALGPTIFVGAVLRLVSLDRVLRRVGRRLGLSIRSVSLRDPLAAIDVDKPSDHRLVEDILAGIA
jgi:GTP:adenosylcobinamide-phosphate guanylyltransferase